MHSGSPLLRQTMAVRVNEETVIRVDGNAKPWVPSMLTRNNKKFMRLNLLDSELARFLGMNPRKEKQAIGIDQLAALRDVASRQWCVNASQCNTGGAFASEEASGVDPLQLAKGLDLPIEIDVKVPDREEPVTVLFSLDQRDAVAIEVTTANMGFIKDVGKSGIPGLDTNTADARGRKRKKPLDTDRVLPPQDVDSPMRWCGTRKSWLVEYYDATCTKTKYKYFKVGEGDRDAMAREADSFYKGNHRSTIE